MRKWFSDRHQEEKDQHQREQKLEDAEVVHEIWNHRRETLRQFATGWAFAVDAVEAGVDLVELVGRSHTGERQRLANRKPDRRPHRTCVLPDETGQLRGWRVADR